jgi:hypothetical protein
MAHFKHAKEVKLFVQDFRNCHLIGAYLHAAPIQHSFTVTAPFQKQSP